MIVNYDARIHNVGNCPISTIVIYDRGGLMRLATAEPIPGLVFHYFHL